LSSNFIIRTIGAWSVGYGVGIHLILFLLDFLDKAPKGVERVSCIHLKQEIVTHLEGTGNSIDFVIEATLEFVDGVHFEAGEGEGQDVEGVGQLSGRLPNLEVPKELFELVFQQNVIVVGQCVFPQGFAHPSGPQQDHSLGIKRFQEGDEARLIDPKFCLLLGEHTHKAPITVGKLGCWWSCCCGGGRG